MSGVSVGPFPGKSRSGWYSVCVRVPSGHEAFPTTGRAGRGRAGGPLLALRRPGHAGVTGESSCPPAAPAWRLEGSGKQLSHLTFATCPDLPPLKVWPLLTCVTGQRHLPWDPAGRKLSAAVRQRTGRRECSSPAHKDFRDDSSAHELAPGVRNAGSGSRHFPVQIAVPSPIL